MDVDTYFSTIIDSEPEDWLISEPTYLCSLSQVSGGGHPVPWIETSHPHSLFTLRTNLSISIAMGRNHLDKFQEEWARDDMTGAYPSSSFFDFLYNGMHFYSSVYVAVDGGRCCLPSMGQAHLVIPETQNYIYRLLHHVSGAGEYNYDQYLARTGAILVDLPWPARLGG